MNGAQHYRQAEKLVDKAHKVNRDEPKRAAFLMASAQVHATLALAAATAYPAVKDYHGDEGSEAYDWTQVTA